jgi:hypothetical protein
LRVSSPGHSRGATGVDHSGGGSLDEARQPIAAGGPKSSSGTDSIGALTRLKIGLAGFFASVTARASRA